MPNTKPQHHCKKININNAHIYTCTNAINRLRAQGFEPTMIDNVETEKAVLTHIIERLRTGWTYVKADSETLKI